MLSLNRIIYGKEYIWLIIILLIYGISYGQEEEFPYSEREWATYSSGRFDFQGNIIIDGKTEELDSYQPRPYQFLSPYISNPDQGGFNYLAKISNHQEIDFVKLYGPALPEDPGGTIGTNSLSGPLFYDGQGNTYKIATTGLEEGIGTEGAYHPDFYNNWSDPYDVLLPGWDTPVTIPPQSCLDAVIIKFNPEGEKLWGSYYNGNQSVNYDSVRWSTVQGGFIYLFGVTTSYEGIATPGTFVEQWGEGHPHHEGRRFLQKIDVQSGIPVWGTYLLTDQEEEGHENPQGIHFKGNYKATSDGYFIYPAPSGSENLKIRILAPDGTLYNEFEAGLHKDAVNFMEIDESGNFYLTGSVGASFDYLGTEGSYKPVKTAEKEYFIAKYNKDGEKLWATYLFETAGNVVPDLNIGFYAGKSDVYFAAGTPETGLATEGAYQAQNAGGFDIAFGKLNGVDGSLKWMSYYGGSGNDVALQVMPDENDNLYIMGFTGSSAEEILTENALFPSPIRIVNTGDRIPFAVKFTHEKNLSTPTLAKDSFKLYPNPAQEQITVQSTNILDTDTRLVIYDLLGRELTRFKGNYTFEQTIDISKLSGGVYFLSVEKHGQQEFLRFVKE